jgi:hypothetical protein
MALEDLPFFFMRWGAHISFLQDAITQKPLLDSRSLTVLYFCDRWLARDIGPSTGKGV